MTFNLVFENTCVTFNDKGFICIYNDLFENFK